MREAGGQVRNPFGEEERKKVGALARGKMFFGREKMIERIIGRALWIYVV